MDIDRRTALATALLLLSMESGCALAGARKSSLWDAYKRQFMAPEGRVVDTGNGGISHSEGQGYGMVLAEANDDRDSFDLLWKWTQQRLARPDVSLFSWRYDPSSPTPVSDPNNATDGDMLIAWALLRGSIRWKDHELAAQSRAIRTAILSRLVVARGGHSLLLPGLQGFVNDPYATINPSYYIWPALDAFRAVDKLWNPIITGGELLLQRARFGAVSLPTDWIDVNDNGLQPAAGHPARFGFDAMRIPLYLGWSGRRDALAPFRTFWGGYVARKQQIPAWIDVLTGEIAPFALSPGGQAVANYALTGKAAVGPTLPADYYASTLMLLTDLAARRA